MCQGFGCNAVGVIGCRIIDSPRERLIAIITNSFVPCNGRFPTMIAIIAMFFTGAVSGPFGGIASALLLTAVIALGIALTLLISKLLSKTILKGLPSHFILELPPYRKPQIAKVITRSLFDRTLFVLGRAITAAAPAGALIWILANLHMPNGDVTLLTALAGVLDPFAQLIGLDGYILLAFILGFPANEIVVPILIMCYMSTGTLTELSSMTELKALLLANGWTYLTAINVILFNLSHWPCATTLLTIKKETGSLKWTAVSLIVPAITGFTICFLVASVARVLGV